MPDQTVPGGVQPESVLPSTSSPEDAFPKWGEPAIRVLMMPRDTNAYGTIFGGVVLSYIDQAGAIEARRQGCNFIVTVSMDKIVFHAPVYVGDLVSFWTDTLRIGRTSITTRVIVKATRNTDLTQEVTVTEAQVVYVNLDENRMPAPIRPSIERD
ncbi:MAG: acyl-CoA thioesterase [Acidobacteriota bacterium]